jgi:hypothetical protein
MKDVAKIPGLHLRRKTWHIRVRVPAALLQAYKPKTEIVRSLQTRDYDMACKRVHKMRVIIQSEFDEKRHQMKKVANDADMLSKFSGHDIPPSWACDGCA